MAIPTFKVFRNLADRYASELPPRLLRDLNGGILVLPEGCFDGEYWLMGEYLEDQMGRTIVLYYGSFRELFPEEPLRVWAEEIETTIWHELRHHVEALAGCDDLTEEEWEELRRERAEDRPEEV
jgi:hypothetical protein